MKETLTRNTIHEEVQQIVEHTALVSLFAQSDGRALASVINVDGRRRIIPVRSEHFRDWLTTAYFRNHDGLPRAESIAEAMRQIEQQAQVNRVVPRPEGARRVTAGTSEDGSDTITVQLGNALADSIAISKDGWRVIENLDADVPKRGAAMLALPRPEQPRDTTAIFRALQELLHLSNDENWGACRKWLIAALRPSGPYPILLIKGPKGSGKATAAALLRGLIDPSGAPLCRLSTIDRSVRQLTTFNWVVALADLTPSFSHLSETLAHMGDSRPLILTADSALGWKPSPEIARRAIVVEMEPLVDKRCESELWARFRAVRPQMLGILCATASAGLRAGARDLDSWMVASELVAGRTGSRFDRLSDAICNLMQTQDEWNGRTTELLRVLETTHPGSAAGTATPKAISDRMNGALAALRSRGVRHEFARGRLRLQRTTPLAPVM